MPAYNFQKQFVPMILDGSKIHTIRRRRKHPVKVGDELKLYTGMRTKACKLIAEVRCVNVVPCTIWPWEEHFAANIHTSIYDFVKGDGFENVHSFFEFFKRYELPRLDDFEIVYWDTQALVRYMPYSQDEWAEQTLNPWTEKVNHETR